jgi:hypothetical protein
VTPRFSLGRVVATTQALSALDEASVDPLALLYRHAAGDWGEIPACDAKENEMNLKHGWRVLSSYPLKEDGRKIWIITEADRTSTCLLLPEEY